MEDAISILRNAVRLLGGTHPDFTAALAAAEMSLAQPSWSVLVSGLCSVGKSSFVCALWGDSDLLPTAVRDCTQTNSLIRRPGSGETDRHIYLKYLERGAAENFALKGLACHRLTEMLEDFHGVAMPRLDEMPPDERLRFVAREARNIYASRREIMVLNEPLTEELEQLENFIEFLDSAEYKPGLAVEARWDERRENLMGRRLPDGRLTGTGRLMALEHVELLRDTEWQPAGLPAPVLIDTPWVPALHNARREDLIVDQARRADVLLVLALPQRFDCEHWLLTLLRERPAMVRRTLVIFNQVDTCDPRTLFSREAFSGVFNDNQERLARIGFDPANILVACSRLRFLQDSLKQQGASGNPRGQNAVSPFGSSGLEERIARLEKVLGHMRGQARSRPESDLQSKLLAACDPADAGVETVRRKLPELIKKVVLPEKRAASMDAVLNVDPVDLPARSKGEWAALCKAAAGVKTREQARH